MWGRQASCWLPGREVWWVVVGFSFFVIFMLLCWWGCGWVDHETRGFPVSRVRGVGVRHAVGS